MYTILITQTTNQFPFVCGLWSIENMKKQEHRGSRGGDHCFKNGAQKTSQFFDLEYENWIELKKRCYRRSMSSPPQPPSSHSKSQLLKFGTGDFIDGEVNSVRGTKGQ
ncbi:hypothetical protein QYF36_025544 [Acer negundo]|nr:hypothetical protein QYF36_025544 [Acer negundo]